MSVAERKCDPELSASVLQSHMPGIDVLRGIAILMVILFHGLYYSAPSFRWNNGIANALFSLTSGGWAGVNLFFALSGFLITGNLIDSKRKNNYYSRFYIRRALRILPIYLVILMILGVLRLATPAYLVVCAFFLANMPGLFLHGFYVSYSPLWSLAVEEQFYLVWPSLYRLLKMKGLLYLCLAMIVVCPLLRAAAIGNLIHTGEIFSKTWMIADNLAMGAVVAIVPRLTMMKLKSFLGFGLAAVSFSSASLILLALTHHLIKTDLIGGSIGYTMIELLGTGWVVVMLYAYRRRPLQRGIGIFVFFGDISYGLYLIHMLCFEVYDRFAGQGYRSHAGELWVRFLICNGIAILLAYVSKRFFENPILKMKNRIPAAM
ncbi:acyltransferase [Edaphobacter paludis]|uniref:Acyltransferase n=1 Tax=Edaphobacter paludis TaxID=3035702 RepID=A0AAU7D646_9BACT